MDIHRSNINNFILPKVKSVYLIDYYERIQSILIGRKDFNFKDLLANPRVRTQNEIIWSTESFSHKPVLLSSLSGYEKDKYSYLLNQCIHSVEYLIDTLKAKDGGLQLSELLNKSIPYIDEKSVYCGEDKIVLVNLGLIPRIQDQTSGQIYRSGEFIGNCDKKQEELLWNNISSKAKRNNCTIVFAAGNDNMIAGIDPKKRSKNIIKVSAVNKELKKADFSNYGIYPDLYREYSTLSAPGLSIYSAAPDNQYVSMQGTSMAAPVVSGAVALLKSIDKNLTTEQVISLLKETGENIDSNIGSMINIGKALQTLICDTIVDDKCDKIKKEVEILKAKIDSLASICPDAVEPADTLKYTDAVKDKNGLDGVWKSSTRLVSTSDKSPLELYMTFRKLRGTLTIINKGVTYTAKLKAKIKNGKISIIQEGPATDGNNSFLPYVYECVSDNKGYFLCSATSAENKVIFNLIRIK